MAEYTYHPVRATTAARLDAIVADRIDASKAVPLMMPAIMEIRGMGKFCYDDGWKRMRLVREPLPDFAYLLVYGDFPGEGGIFGVCKLPPAGKVNWHKVIIPALNRIIRAAGFPAKTYYACEDGHEELFNGGKFPRYEFNGRDFILVKKSKVKKCK